jgi:hypothetical protein
MIPWHIVVVCGAGCMNQIPISLPLFQVRAKRIWEPQRGHPLKGPCQENKPLLLRKNYPLFLQGLPLRTSPTLCMMQGFSPRPVFRSRVSASYVYSPQQSPIRIKACETERVFRLRKHAQETYIVRVSAPVRVCGPRKSSVPCRVQLVVSQILWFLANPCVVHGMGGGIIKHHHRAGRLPIKSGGCANPSAGSPPRPNLTQRAYSNRTLHCPSLHSKLPVPTCAPVRYGPP